MEMDNEVHNSYNQIMAIGLPSQVSREYLNGLELFEKCLQKSLIYVLASWGSITDKEISLIEKLHGKYLNYILELPPSTPYVALIIETGLRTLGFSI